ncbi:hypothetical protein P8452_52614 [Trifolium repens]|nr:hypothetical protein P8452_52614 [Trifolium repens]
MSNNINEQQHPVIAYPVVDKDNTVITPPPPMGYPTKNAPQQEVPVVTTNKGGCEVAHACCHCMLFLGECLK